METSKIIIYVIVDFSKGCNSNFPIQKVYIYKVWDHIILTVRLLKLNRRKMNSTDESSNWPMISKKSSKEMKMGNDAKKKPTTNKATRPFIIKETMIIEPDNMDFVVGRKGCL